MSLKPTIELIWLRQLGLIISHHSGVIYTNQVGGFACLHPEIEGVFVPLSDDSKTIEQRLSQHFTGAKWKGHCYKGIDEETADFTDDLLSLNFLTKRLKVDRDKLKESIEAWIWVEIDESDFIETQNGTIESEFRGFPSRKGILTWENSD